MAEDGGRGGRRGRLRLLLYGLVALWPHFSLVFVALGSSIVSTTATASAGCARQSLISQQSFKHLIEF